MPLYFIIALLVSFTDALELPRATPQFANAHEVGKVYTHYVTEASGLCASRSHNNVLYTHNDSGDYSHRIYAINATNGQRLALITIDGASENDWEDICCGPCPGGSGNCIYLADTGGNAGRDANTVYRIREPAQIKDQHVRLDSYLKFSWNQHDCETIMVDPQGRVYLVSKVKGARGKLVMLPNSAWGHSTRTYVSGGVYLPIHSSNYNPVGGDISLNGNDVLIKTYGHIYYWSIPDHDYYKGMVKTPATLPYRGERQGESVCWDNRGIGYFTLSEGARAPLYYYHRHGYPNPVVGK